LRQFGKTRRTAELQRVVYLGEDVGFNRGERQHGPDECGRFVRLLDTELRRRPGRGLIARTSEF
jgi:hypothetical protein